MRHAWLILILSSTAPGMLGCDRDRPGPPEKFPHQAPPAATPLFEPFTAEHPPATAPAYTPLPDFSPLPPPPARALPPMGPQAIPTRYVTARPGQRMVFRIQTLDGKAVTQATEVLAIEPRAIVLRKSVTSQYGQFSHDIRQRRFIPPGQGGDWPAPAGTQIGEELIEVGHESLLCEVYETKRSGRLYRTWLCRDVPGWIVRYQDENNGLWTTRLDLIEWTRQFRGRQLRSGRYNTLAEGSGDEAGL
jgi:hypothetical protein